jgi:hypothetical protein
VARAAKTAKHEREKGFFITNSYGTAAEISTSMRGTPTTAIRAKWRFNPSDGPETGAI